MAAKDITSLRPWYLSATMLRDFHYTVYNKAGDVVLVLVTNKGENRAFFTHGPDEREHKVLYVNSVEKARICMAQYSRDYTDLVNALNYWRFPPGDYGLSVVNVAGERLYTFEFTLA